MKHITLDCYGASQYSLNDLTTVYQILNYVGYKFGLVPIAPPHIIPYYYGRVKKDSGISAYVLLKGGHVTIHTFPFRECYFVDVFSTTDFDEKQIYDYFMETLPFDEKASNFEIINRNERTFHKNPYDTDCDFGPHLMCEIDANKEIKYSSKCAELLPCGLCGITNKVCPSANTTYATGTQTIEYQED